MTEKMIHELSLEYLMNKTTYEKYCKKTVPTDKTVNKKDKKFYRKRIYDLTKQLLNPEITDTAPLYPNINHTFDNYVKACIDYFKMIDKTDIIQEDYKDFTDILDMDKSNEINVDNIQTSKQADQLIMRSIKIREPNSLEKLVKRTTIKVENPPALPQQKDINLKDPLLKNKGIRKKKNITNKYDKTDDKKTNETTEIKKTQI